MNTEQFAMVKRVADRVMDEMRAVSKQNFHSIGEPLRWSMHGGPGTGKTHVIQLLKEELFGQVLKWNIGVEFQIVAFQAVMADLLEGDTIHHAFNINIFGKQKEPIVVTVARRARR